MFTFHVTNIKWDDHLERASTSLQSGFASKGYARLRSTDPAKTGDARPADHDAFAAADNGSSVQTVRFAAIPQVPLPSAMTEGSRRQAGAETGKELPLKASVSAFKTFQNSYDFACKSDKTEAKEDFLNKFNSNWSARLTTEDAAMQMLAQRLAYINLPDGAAVHFHVQKDFEGLREYTYPRQAKVLKTIVHPHGLKAYVLVPSDEADEKSRVIILFKGTGVYDGLGKKLGEATGMTANVDQKGIAFQAFAEKEQELMSFVNKAFTEGREITLVGHSLGGACAARLMTRLSPVQQSGAKLITFGSPQLDEESAGLVKKANPNVRCWQVKGDVIPMAGSQAPEGRYLVLERSPKAYNLNSAHGDMPLVTHDFEKPGGNPKEIISETSAQGQTSRAVELIRRLGGNLFGLRPVDNAPLEGARMVRKP